MGTTLTGKKIKDTYKSLIKVSDNTEAGSSAKQLSDGDGNDFGLYVDTDGVVGIGGAASYSLDVSSNTDGVALPVGTTANRPTGAAGLIRYNSTLGKLEYYDTEFKKIASESYVNTQIDAVLDSAPGTLDTLNELAAALNDDPDFYTTITGLINAKQATITGAATTITSSDLTASRAVVSNASGKIAVSAVTDTELGYLDGVTSAIQTQIDGKQDTLTAGTGIDITSDTISADLSGLVDTGAIQSDAVTAPKIAQFDDNLTAATAGDIMISDGTDFTDVTVSGDVTINSSGVTTIGNDKIDSQHYAAGSIDEEHLNATNTPTDGYVLTYDNTSGGFTWEEKFDGDITGIVAGNGLTGDASSGEASLAVGAGTGITVNANDVQITDGGVDTAQLADDAVTAAKIEDNVQLDGTESIGIPAGTTAQRPSSPAAGMFRYNTTDNKFEGYTTEWGEIGGGGSATLAVEQDTFNGDGSTTAFTLTSSVDSENNTQVFIDGVYQSKDNYSTSGSTLTFTTAPATGTNNIEVIHITSMNGAVQVDSFTGDGSDTTFDLTTSISSENNTQVYLDGVYQSKENYSTTTNTITFTTAPPNGVDIEVVHLIPSGDFTLTAVDSTDDAIVRLSGTNGFTDDVKLVAGTNIDISVSGDDITINSTDTNTIYTAGSGLDLTNEQFSVEADLRDGITHIGVDTGDYIQFTADTQMDFYVNGSNEMRLESDGDLHVDGDVIAASTTVSSDENLKENINVFENALDSLEHLKGVSFDWKKDKDKSGGVIAQDVLKVYPYLVKDVKDLNCDCPSHLTVNYNGLVGVLIEAVKELNQKVKELESK